MGIGFAVGLSMVAMGLSLFVLLRPPMRSLQRDLKATVRRLEAECDEAYERLNAASGRYAKQRGLLEAAKPKKQDKVQVVRPEPPISTRSQLWKLYVEKEKANGRLQNPASSSKSPSAP